MLSRFSDVGLFLTLWTVARQAPLSMGFSRQEHWSGLSSPPPGDLPDPGIQFLFPALAGGFFTTSATWGSVDGKLLRKHQGQKGFWSNKPNRTLVAGELGDQTCPAAWWRMSKFDQISGVIG